MKEEIEKLIKKWEIEFESTSNELQVNIYRNRPIELIEFCKGERLTIRLIINDLKKLNEAIVSEEKECDSPQYEMMLVCKNCLKTIHESHLVRHS